MSFIPRNLGELKSSVQTAPQRLLAICGCQILLLLIGVFVGGLQATPDADDRDTRYLQTTCLVLCSVAFLLYLIVVRPFAVPVANFFESLVVCAQIACLSRNYWFIKPDRTVLGVTADERSAASAIYYIILVSVIAMLLRLVAVMLPAR